MEYTPFQKKTMDWARMAKVSYDNMWISQKKLGFCTPDKPLDMIHIAKDFPDEDVKKLALLHEVGHIYYGHMSVNIKEEILSVRDIFKELDRPFECILQYGGPHAFINICMDLEVNAKLFTLSNIKTMDKSFSICTPDKYNVSYQNTFRDYYRPMVERLETDSVKFDDTMLATQPIAYRSCCGRIFSAISDLSDLISRASKCDSDFDDETQRVLDKEDWVQTGDLIDKSDSKTTIGDELDNDSQVDKSSFGSNHLESGSHATEQKSDKLIRQFLCRIVKTSMSYQPDSLKHFNRGTRKNDQGFMYTSLRRRADIDHKKIMFICDVSGSMDISSIAKALSSLKSSINQISPEARLVTWDTDKVEEFSIDKMPKAFKHGGGTDMAKAVEYAVSQGYRDVVLYSDLDTDVSSLIRAAEKLDSINTIFVNSMHSESYVLGVNRFLEMNDAILKI